jgi:hypothetical protein
VARFPRYKYARGERGYPSGEAAHIVAVLALTEATRPSYLQHGQLRFSIR